MPLRQMLFSLFVLAFRPAYASQIHYQPMRLDELVRQSPLIIEAAPLESSGDLPDGARYKILQVLHVASGVPTPKVGDVLRVRQGGTSTLRAMSAAFQKDGTMRSPIIPEYTGEHLVTKLTKGTSYLLFVGLPDPEGQTELVAVNSATTMKAEAAVKAAIAKKP